MKISKDVPYVSHKQCLLESIRAIHGQSIEFGQCIFFVHQTFNRHTSKRELFDLKYKKFYVTFLY